LFLLGGLATWVVALAGGDRDHPPMNRPIQVPVGGYVTSDTCRSCHPGNYASWHASYHRTMTQVARPENFAGPIDGFTRTFDGVDYRVERQGDRFLSRKRPAGGSGAWSEPQQIVLLTGSHNMQILWLETGAGRTLVQFPFAYLTGERIWAPVIQTFVAPPEFKTLYLEGEWNSACLDCHTTAARPRFESGRVFDSQVAEFGISCESCHGEGAEHVAQNRNPLRRFALHLGGKHDATIVNPANLDGPRSALACGQCHSIAAFTDSAHKQDWSRQGRVFRPGQADLGDQRFIVRTDTADHPAQKRQLLQTSPTYFSDRFWGDGMVRVTGRELNGVMASPCYKGGHFACVSCHELHPKDNDPATLAGWRAQQFGPEKNTDVACLQCHEDKRAQVAAHTHHAAGSPGSACYNCHLPHTAVGLLHAIRTHQVGSPSVRESVAYGRPNACNLCHLDRTLAWTADRLSDWYGQKPPELDADQRAIAAGVLWLLKGDAGQRALVAWSMGWAPAQQAAGRGWIYPYLAVGLQDPYAVVRFISWQSLKSLPGFAGTPFDYTQEGEALSKAVRGNYQKWWQDVRTPGAAYPAATLLSPDGRFQADNFKRLFRERDQSPVFIVE
jgi:hypothetical protein